MGNVISPLEIKPFLITSSFAMFINSVRDKTEPDFCQVQFIIFY